MEFRASDRGNMRHASFANGHSSRSAQCSPSRTVQTLEAVNATVMQRTVREYGLVGIGVLVLLGCASAEVSPRIPSSPNAPFATADAQASVSSLGNSSDATPAAGTGSSASVDSQLEPRWLGPREVARAVRVHGSAFSACRTLADAESQRLDGAVTVGWLVESNGRVDDVTIGQSSFESAEINACVLSVARKVTFPASPAPSQVSWTVKFRGSASGALAGTDRRFVAPR